MSRRLDKKFRPNDNSFYVRQENAHSHEHAKI